MSKWLLILLAAITIVACSAEVGVSSKPANSEPKLATSVQGVRVILVKTTRGTVECVRINEYRAGGMSCDWDHVK